MRYLPLTDADRLAMLAVIGVESSADLFRDVPESARRQGPVEALARHSPEYEVERELLSLASGNLAAGSVPFFLGAGAYRHHVPASVDALIQRGEFLTSYTPYQPEVSQGTLQYLFEFQTQVALLTDMDVANASMYDGASAAAEAVMMANRVTKRKKVVISGGLHPHYREVTETMARMTGFSALLQPGLPGAAEDLAALIDHETSCVVVQNPDFFGFVRDYTALSEACHKRGALLIVVVTEIVSLGLLMPPGAMGADIVVGEGQSLGNALSFGGPYLGLFACREAFIRQMPGRVCGQTIDHEGRPGFVLTLSAREQHIRREKATSNICTNSGLCALAFTIHCALLGETGLKKLAALNHAKACQLADRLAAVPGVTVLNDTFFNEFTVRLKVPAAALVDRLVDRSILAGVPLSRLSGEGEAFENLLLVAATELTTDDAIEALAKALGEEVG